MEYYLWYGSRHEMDKIKHHRDTICFQQSISYFIGNLIIDMKGILIFDMAAEY